ncbi:adenosylcobinamide-GDP ribazoletransferase [Vibrio sp. 10N.222.51.C12]|uniref:adenosylcobinamide-GDP ribazoletransferase n=1 Tax=unclassified Vibrio TaxID=2614977 RepID=UPI000C819B45|nr:adenosylcobinamide-GDP ribazoletransferase [Vibrio sp. 10N.286.48.B7]PMH77715.1 cobalamin 5'-phosphate synthase [Vibrio sp. 10N.286.48.B7]
MQGKIIREWQLYLLAISTFTRLPVRGKVPYTESRQNESYKYAGLVGLLIGLISAVTFYVSDLLWTTEIAVVVSMIISIYCTGAFHEDGFADTCDGFGGAFFADRKLEIMKDSRVGAYALLGMIMILLLKYTALIGSEQVLSSLVIAHVLSRTIAVSFCHTHHYVRDTQSSKVKISNRIDAKGEQVVLILVALAVVTSLLSWGVAAGLVTCLLLLRWLLSRWLIRHIGGYTGDALGAVQQISEIACYLYLHAILKV